MEQRELPASGVRTPGLVWPVTSGRGVMRDRRLNQFRVRNNVAMQCCWPAVSVTQCNVQRNVLSGHADRCCVLEWLSERGSHRHLARRFRWLANLGLRPRIACSDFQLIPGYSMPLLCSFFDVALYGDSMKNLDRGSVSQVR